MAETQGQFDSSLPAHREAAFIESCAARVRVGAAEGKSPQAVMSEIFVENRFLAAALAEPAFKQAMAQAFHRAMAKRLQPDFAPTIEESRRATDGILYNRIADAKKFEMLAANPAFINHVARQSAQPPAPPREALPPNKQIETVERMLQENDPRGAEPAVHVLFTAQGQGIGHDALAEIFNPEGELLEPLAAALKKHLPNAPDDKLRMQASVWLSARRAPAAATAEALKPGGVLYQQAANRADAIQQGQRTLHGTSMAAPLLAAGHVALAPAGANTPEEKKTRQQKAEDIIYTLNHSIACLSITDLLVVPTIAAATGNKDLFGGHVHNIGDLWKTLTSKSFWKNFLPNAQKWFVGEFIGDMGAVPVTLAVQRFAPGFMQGTRNVLEPMVGGLFRDGANRASENWADKNGKPRDSQEVKDRADRLYEYEISHLPQMAVWTVSSIVINYGVMKLMHHMAVKKFEKSHAAHDHHEHGHAHEHHGHGDHHDHSHDKPEDFTVKTFLKGKAVSSGITAGMVFGWRALTPESAHSWDENVSKHLIVPVASVFGISEDDIDRNAKKRQGDKVAFGPLSVGQYDGRLALAPEPSRETP